MLLQPSNIRRKAMLVVNTAAAKGVTHKKSTNRCCSPPTSIAMLVANTVVAKGVRVLRDVAAFPAEHSGGYMVYAVVH